MGNRVPSLGLSVYRIHAPNITKILSNGYFFPFHLSPPLFFFSWLTKVKLIISIFLMLLTIIPLQAGDEYDMLVGWGYSRRVVQIGKTPEGSAVKISTLTVQNPDPYDADPYFTAGGA